MTDVLAETIQKLTARRATLAREVATLDEAIGALVRVRDQPTTTALAPPSPRGRAPLPDPMIPLPPPCPAVCALASCGKSLPPPSRKGGRPRTFCTKGCFRKANRLRKAEPADDGEDPTDRAIRLHKEMNPVPESGTAYRNRGAVNTRGRT